MPPSLTTWTRLEPYARSAQLEGGLNAAIHDPLWLIARQWQLGKFQGEDVGSPVHVRMDMTCTPITRYQPGRSSGEGQLLKGAIPPLETLIEQETVRIQRDTHSPSLVSDEGALQPKLSAEAGLHFLRLLNKSHRSFILANFPLKSPLENPNQPFDEDSRRFLQVTEGRVPDGELLYYVIRIDRHELTLDALKEPYQKRVSDAVKSWQDWYPNIPEPEHTKVTEAIRTWTLWYETLFSEPSLVSKSSWIPEHMEYSAQIAAPVNSPASKNELVLSAPEYTNGYLDWYCFDVMESASLGAKHDDLSDSSESTNPNNETKPIEEKIKASAIPVPVYFRGMPASRYWEFEDARIDFGAINAGKQQLARLLLIEFGLISGDDWFILPVVVPIGSLCRTNCLIVSDTFGERTLVSSSRTVDQREEGENELPWDLFRLSPIRRSSGGTPQSTSDLLFLPPTLGSSLQGASLEEVLFLRDEMANMAWAVERIVENLIGRPINRTESYFRSRKQAGSSSASEGTTDEAQKLPIYRLVKDAPPSHWVPLLPTRIKENEPSIALQRGHVKKGQICGRILEPSLELLDIQEEEVPREGARVTRTFQYAPWVDGNTYLWVGRRKGVGRGEGSSGLQFDVLVSPRE